MEIILTDNKTSYFCPKTNTIYITTRNKNREDFKCNLIHEIIHYTIEMYGNDIVNLIVNNNLDEEEFFPMLIAYQWDYIHQLYKKGLNLFKELQ